MSHQSRREFLENSLLAASAAALAGTAPTQLATAAPQSSSPNEKLRVAVIGVRGRGRSHIAGFGARKDCQLAVFCDVDENIGRNAAAKSSKQKGYKVAYEKDIRKVLDDKSIDIVSIATPNHWHALGAIWAIQAGKDVYLEKPVSHNVSEGRRIVQAARKYNKIVQTGTQSRSNPGMMEAIEFVQSGKIGDVNKARGLCYKPRGPIGKRGKYECPAGVDYSLWLGPAQEKPLTRPKLHYDWHWQWDYGNGDLGNQGIHQMDIGRWGLGVSGIGQSVQSYGGRLGYEDAGETANTQVSIHDYGDKQLIFEVRGLKTAPFEGAKIGVIFYGSEGYVSIPNYYSGTAFDKDGKIIAKFNGNDGNGHFNNFVDAVRKRNVATLNADIEEGHISSALCHLGNISYRLGEKMDVMAAKKQMRGSEENVSTLERVTDHLKQNGVNLGKTPLQLGPKLSLNSSQEVFTGEMASTANPHLTRDYRKPFIVPGENDV